MMKTMTILATSIVLVLAATVPAGALSLDLPNLMDTKNYSINQTDNIDKSDKGIEFKPDIDSPEEFFAPEKDFAEITSSREISTVSSESDQNFPVRPVVNLEENSSSNGPAPVPEPTTLVLLGSGLIGLTCLGRKNRRSHE